MKKTKIFFTIFITLLFIYTIFGFFAIPYIATKILPKTLQKQGLSLSLEKASFNPLSLELNLKNISISTNAPLFQADEIYTNLAFLPLLKGEIDITALRLNRPNLSITLGQKSNIITKEEKDKSSNSNIKLRLSGLEIVDAALSYNAPNAALNLSGLNYKHSQKSYELNILGADASLNLNGLNLGATQISTNDVQIGFDKLDLSNELSINSSAQGVKISTKKASIVGLKASKDELGLKANAELLGLELFLPSAKTEGNIALQSLLLSNLSAKTTGLSIGLKSLEASELATNLSDALKTQIKELNAQNIAIASEQAKILTSSLAKINNIKINAGISDIKSIEIGATKLFADQDSGFSSLVLSGTSINTKLAKIDSLILQNPSFKSELKNGELSALKPVLEFISASKGKVKAQIVSQNNLAKAKNDQTPEPTNQQKSLELNITTTQIQGAKLDIEHIFNGKTIPLKAQNIDLKLDNFSTNAPFNLSLNIKDEPVDISLAGNVSLSPLKGKLKLGASLPLEPYLAYASPFELLGTAPLQTNIELDIDGLKFKLQASATLGKLALSLDNKQILSTQKISLKKLSASNDKTSINGLKIDNPSINLIRQKDKSLNIDALIKTEPKAQKPAPKKTKEHKFEISDLSINDAELSFNDEAVGYQTKIHKIQLNATNPLKIAPISLSANANDAFLSVRGTMLAIKPEDKTDLKVDLKNLNLVRLSPYSAIYLGREISAGLASLSSDIRINSGALNVSNALNFDNLTLGASVKSPDAINLPLDMAVAILKDFKNQINLSLPITASVDDPSFHISGVVLTAITQAITDVVFSPFKFIGKALGMDASKLSAIEFATGSDELLASESQKAQEFKQIVQAKGLKITITPAYALPADADAIASKQAQKLKLDEKQAKELRQKVAQDELIKLAISRANAVREMLLKAGVMEQNIKIQSDISTLKSSGGFVGIKMGISR